MDDGRTTEPAYTISSPGAFGSGELKSYIYIQQSFFYVKKYLKLTSCTEKESHRNYFFLEKKRRRNSDGVGGGE